MEYHARVRNNSLYLSLMFLFVEAVSLRPCQGLKVQFLCSVFLFVCLFLFFFSHLNSRNGFFKFVIYAIFLKILTKEGKKRNSLPKHYLFLHFLALFDQNFQKYCLNWKKALLEKCLNMIFKQLEIIFLACHKIFLPKK